MSEYKEKRIWTKQCDTHSIEISRHEKGYAPDGEGKYAWCVYVYVYPKHPLFVQLDINSSSYLYNDIISRMPLHGGCTYCSINYTDHERGGAGEDYKTVELEAPKRISIKIGCDYAHLYDEGFSFIEDPMGTAIFREAEDLDEWMKYQKPVLETKEIKLLECSTEDES